MKRLAASLEIAGRDNGYPRDARREIVESSVAGYRRAMREFAEMPTLDVWYATADIEAERTRLAPRLERRHRKNIARTVAKAYTKDNLARSTASSASTTARRGSSRTLRWSRPPT